MTPLCIIVARSANKVIGRANALPWNVPEDMDFFKDQTLTYPVIMGKNTWLSLNGKPLSNRLNVVISATKVDHPMVYTFPTLRAAHDFLTLSRNEAAFVIGGAQLYAEAMLQAQEVLLTEFDFYVEGDTYFDYPQLKDAGSWQRYERKEITSTRSTTHPNCQVTFSRYVRVSI